MHSGPHKGYLQVVAKYCALQVGYHKETESILWFNQLSITLTIHKMNTVRFLVTTYCKVQCIALCRVVSSKRLHIQFQSSYTQSHNHGALALICVGKPVGSQWVMRPVPDFPATNPDQELSKSLPRGVTRPTPVMTTRGTWCREGGDGCCSFMA